MSADITIHQLQEHVRALRRHFERDLAEAEQRFADATHAHHVELEELREALILLRRKLQLQVDAAARRERQLQAELIGLRITAAGELSTNGNRAPASEVGP